MAVASVKTPIAPPSASISRTICPLATPPIAGLQLIWPTVSQFIVKKRGPQPHPRGGQRGFQPGVAGADDDHVKVVGIAHRRYLGQIRSAFIVGLSLSPPYHLTGTVNEMTPDLVNPGHVRHRSGELFHHAANACPTRTKTTAS